MDQPELHKAAEKQLETPVQATMTSHLNVEKEVEFEDMLLLLLSHGREPEMCECLGGC